MKIVALCLCLSLIGCASSNTAKVLNVAVIGAGIADLHSTSVALDRGGVEGNAWMQGSDLRRALLKLGGVGLAIGGAELMDRKGRHVSAHLLRVVAMTAWSVAAVHNYRLGRTR